MNKGLPALKRRIGSIKATKKVTKAMEMIATTRLRTWRETMNETRQYTEALFSIIREHLTTPEVRELPYFCENEVDKSAYVIITSNLGLCGSYNYNMYQYVAKNVHDKDEIIIIGDRGARYYQNRQRNIRLGHVTITSSHENEIKHLATYLLDSFKAKQFKNINIIYTKYINSLTFQPTIIKLLPLKIDDEQNIDTGYGPIIEPSIDAVIEALLPFYLNNVLFASLVEAQVSEQSSRRFAMEKASDNADELIEELELEYNKLRQAAITQEIAEIIGGSM
jgi:F-type H+-transporting ATPase subunit gamma